MNFWCKIFGHDYGYFHDDNYRYRNCRRCSNAHEIIGKAGEEVIRDTYDKHKELPWKLILMTVICMTISTALFGLMKYYGLI
jgi:hypothetical protein